MVLKFSRDIYFAKYYGGGEWLLGNKMKTDMWGEKRIRTG